MSLEQKDNKVQSTKYDGGKPRMALVPQRALLEVAKVFTFGANRDPNLGPIKYDVGNWHAGDGFDWDRLQSASDRHGAYFALGEDNDPESNLHHLAHRICCDLMLLEHALTGHGNDNRSKSQYIPQENLDGTIPFSRDPHVASQLRPILGQSGSAELDDGLLIRRGKTGRGRRSVVLSVMEARPKRKRDQSARRKP